MFTLLTWSVVFQEVYWAPPHTAGQTVPVWAQEEAETWRVMRYPESSAWSLAWPPYSGLDEGTAAAGSALEVHPQSTNRVRVTNSHSLMWILAVLFWKQLSHQMNWTLVWKTLPHLVPGVCKSSYWEAQSQHHAGSFRDQTHQIEGDGW